MVSVPPDFSGEDLCHIQQSNGVGDRRGLSKVQTITVLLSSPCAVGAVGLSETKPFTAILSLILKS